MSLVEPRNDWIALIQPRASLNCATSESHGFSHERGENEQQLDWIDIIRSPIELRDNWIALIQLRAR
jgi:hypothetical protein